MRKINALLLAVATLLSILSFTACQIGGTHAMCEKCGRCAIADCTVEGHEVKCECALAGTGELPTYGPLDGPGFHISIFGDPGQQTVEAYQQLVDMGCDWVYIDPWNGTNINSTGLIKALEACEAVGLNALIMVNNTHMEKGKEYSFLDVATIDYTQYPAFKGVYAFDEPDVPQMEWIANDLARWEDSIYKDYIYMVNLMAYAEPEAPTCEIYLDYYWDLVLSKNDDNWLIYDAYPLNAKLGDKVLPVLGDRQLEFVEEFAVTAVEHGSDLFAYIQTYSSKTGDRREMVSVADARFQIALDLAYGVKGFMPFTYIHMSQFGSGLVTGNGEPTDAYYYVQEVFQELRNFENVFFAFDWKGTMTLLGPNRGTDRGYGEQPEENITKLVHSLESHDRIKSVETEYDLLIGTFKDENDNDGFLITSYTDPYYFKDNNISVEFNNATRALIYYNGELLTNDEAGTCYILEDGVLNFDLEAGDYLFVIPVR